MQIGNFRNLSIAGATLALTLMGCGSSSSGGSGTGVVGLSLKVSAATSALMLQSSDSVSILSNDYTDTVSFTPTSFKLPIMKISIAAADYTNEQILYKCANAAEADCLVDLASQTALDAIATAAASATISAGTYTVVQVSTCADGKSGTDATTAKITGTAPTALVSNTYRTGTGVNGAVTSGTAAETNVGNWSCATKYVKLNPGVTIAAGGTTKLTVLVDNTDLAYFTLNSSGGMGGCKPNGGLNSGLGICVNYPALMGYVGSDTPTIKRFMISHHRTDATQIVQNKANALLMIAVDGTGKPINAFGRTYFGSNSATPGRSTSDTANGRYDVGDPTYAGPGYGNNLDNDTFVVAADNSVSFRFGGSLDSKGASMTGFVASSTATSGVVKTADGVDSWFYKAYPIQ